MTTDTPAVAAYTMSTRSFWSCPKCRRVFRRAGQAHSCGVGSRRALLEGKTAPLVRLYESLEKTLKSLDGVEIVHRGRYALFRTTRIFADLVFMKDALRLALLLPRRVNDPLFFKVAGMSGRRIGHVAKLRRASELRRVLPYLKEAWGFARSEGEQAR